jgi:hypothetical protein
MFLKNKLLVPSNTAIWIKIINSLLLLAALVTVQILVQFFFILLQTGTNSKAMQHYDDTLIKSSSVMYILFLGTLKEELAFRLALTEFEVKYVRISASLIVANLLVIIVAFGFPSIDVNYILLEFGIATLIFVALWTLRVDFLALSKIWERHFKLIIWVSIVAFCLAHLPQLISFGFDFVTISRAMISFLLCAIVYTFVRIKYGIVYAWAIHIIYNYITL